MDTKYFKQAYSYSCLLMGIFTSHYVLLQWECWLYLLWQLYRLIYTFCNSGRFRNCLLQSSSKSFIIPYHICKPED